MDTLRDGKGRGYLAAVNSNNQLIVRTTSVQQHTKSTVDGNYYEATTGVVTLTNAAETGIIYLKNLEQNYLIVDKVFLDVWASTGGSGGGNLKYYKNPTITGGSAIVPANTNFSKGACGRSASCLKTCVLKSARCCTSCGRWHRN